MRVGVTGATGFVGSDIARELLDMGHEVVALVRVPSRTDRAVSARAYDLQAPPASGLLDGLDAVVHSAFVRREPRDSGAYEVNVRGTLALFELALKANVRFLFISSLSAVPDARSAYGRQKHHLESLLVEQGADVVRPGLVVGDGGLVRALFETMRRMHLIPLIDGGRQPVQCVGLRDVSAIVRVVLERRSAQNAVVTVADPRPITARQMALDLRRRFGLRALPVSVPFDLVYPLAALAEAAGVRPPIATETLLGLRAARIQAVTDVGEEFGRALASWPELLAGLEFAPR